MSMRIHYRGKIGDKRTIYQLIDEVREIAEVNGWKYGYLNEPWETAPNARLESAKGPGIKIVGHCALKGIHFQPKDDCEAIWLYFNSGGYISTPFRVALDAEEGYPIQNAWVSSKTPLADTKTHIAVLRILRYLKKRYIPDLEVRDEGGYWKAPEGMASPQNRKKANLKI